MRLQQADRGWPARVQDEDVDPTEFGDGCLCDEARRPGLGGIGRDHGDIGAVSVAEAGGGELEPRLVARPDRQPAALRREPLSRGASEAG